MQNWETSQLTYYTAANKFSPHKEIFSLLLSPGELLPTKTGASWGSSLMANKQIIRL